MQKSSIIRYRELLIRLQDLLNESELPAFVLILILEKIMIQLKEIDEHQYQHDIELSEAAKCDGEQTDQSV